MILTGVVPVVFYFLEREVRDLMVEMSSSTLASTGTMVDVLLVLSVIIIYRPRRMLPLLARRLELAPPEAVAAAPSEKLPPPKPGTTG